MFSWWLQSWSKHDWAALLIWVRHMQSMRWQQQ